MLAVVSAALLHCNQAWPHYRTASLPKNFRVCIVRVRLPPGYGGCIRRFFLFSLSLSVCVIRAGLRVYVCDHPGPAAACCRSEVAFDSSSLQTAHRARKKTRKTNKRNPNFLLECVQATIWPRVGQIQSREIIHSIMMQPNLFFF